jgi:hypothetical protein
MPGFVYGLETIVGLFVLFPDWTRAQLSALAGEESLGVAIAAIFVSGALGYVFATIHHWWHWHVDAPVLDHRPLITRLRARRLIVDELGGQLDRRQALILSMALWYDRVRDNGAIQLGADKKLTSLGDSIHGLGAARIASVFALLTVLGISACIGTFRFELGPIVRFIVVLVLTLGATVLFHKAYINVGEIAQGIYDAILGNALAREQRGNRAA